MKDIVIITNYFPPETGAASNRIHHMAEGFRDHNFNVQVITPLPNYPTGQIFNDYKGAFKRTTKINGITVNRLWIYASNSKNKLLRLLAMLSYSFSLVWFFMWHKLPKTVIIQSPPLLVAFTCMLFLSKRKRQLILNVSDLWPIAGLELGAFKKNFSYKLLERIERFNYNKASVVLGQSEEILTHVKGLFPNKQTFLYRNFPDFNPPKLNPKTSSEHAKIKVVYAGLLGIAQGIYKLIKELDYSNIEFHIYGSGAEQGLVEQYIASHPELPITYHGQVSRDKLHNVLLQYDLTIIPLLNRIYGSVPSKIFEYARLGLPMLYFGGGEGESIITEYNLGWITEAGNYKALNGALNSIKISDLSHSTKIQNTAISAFDFNTQMSRLVKLV